MDNIINDIVWWIPFKKLRNAVRDYLTLDMLYKESIVNYYGMPLYNTFANKAKEESFIYMQQYINDIIFLNRLEEMKYHLENSVEIDGLFLEFGVHKGNSINFCSNILKDKIFYGFDSFEGLPENWTGYSGRAKGSFNLNKKLPKVNNNVKLIEGWFDKTLPLFLQEHQENVSFLHIDSDLYSSAKTILDNLENRIKKGTVIIFDEYINYPNWKNHEFKAFQEFVEKNKIKYRYITIGHICSVGLKIL